MGHQRGNCFTASSLLAPLNSRMQTPHDNFEAKTDTGFALRRMARARINFGFCLNYSENVRGEVFAPSHGNCKKDSKPRDNSTLSLQVSQRIIQFHEV